MNKLTKELIQERMNEIRITPVMIIANAGLGKQNVYNWVKGKATPKGDDYRKFLHALKLTIDQYGELVPIENISTISEVIDEVRYVPVLSYVQAGEFTSNYKYDDTDIEYIPLQASEVPHNAFLMRVRGDSMVYDYSANQRLNISYSRYNINEDELVLVDPSKTNVSNLVGKIAVIHNGNGTTVKLVYQEESGICLMPLNSRLQDNEEIKRPDEAKIIGKVIKVINERNFS